MGKVCISLHNAVFISSCCTTVRGEWVSRKKCSVQKQMLSAQNTLANMFKILIFFFLQDLADLERLMNYFQGKLRVSSISNRNGLKVLDALQLFT